MKGGYKLIHEVCAHRAGLKRLIRHGGEARNDAPGCICLLCWGRGPLALVGPISIKRLARLAARRRVA